MLRTVRACRASTSPVRPSQTTTAAAPTALVEELGWEPVDPMRRDFRGRTEGNEAEIVEGDLEDIEACDAVLADFSEPTREPRWRPGTRTRSGGGSSSTPAGASRIRGPSSSRTRSTRRARGRRSRARRELGFGALAAPAGAARNLRLYGAAVARVLARSGRRSLRDADAASERPVFVLGSPRSGTSFVAGSIGTRARLRRPGRARCPGRRRFRSSPGPTKRPRRASCARRLERVTALRARPRPACSRAVAGDVLRPAGGAARVPAGGGRAHDPRPPRRGRVAPPEGLAAGRASRAATTSASRTGTTPASGSSRIAARSSTARARRDAPPGRGARYVTAAQGAPSSTVDVRYEELAADPETASEPLAAHIGADPVLLAQALGGMHAESIGRWQRNLTHAAGRGDRGRGRGADAGARLFVDLLVATWPRSSRRSRTRCAWSSATRSGRTAAPRHRCGRCPTSSSSGRRRPGTTALYAYLRRHPAITGPSWKEVSFFDRHYARGEAWYRGNFPNALRSRRAAAHSRRRGEPELPLPSARPGTRPRAAPRRRG